MKANPILPNLLIFCLPLLVSCSAGKHAEETRPNIILICADDLGWSDLGCYGSEVRTPNLDKLAEEGMRFTSFYNTSKCFPSRACLLTGVYAQQSGYHEKFRSPLRNAVTLGEVLRSAGYRTWFSGKHHGLENPYDRGFDHYSGLKDGACNHFNPGLQREGEPAPANKGRERYWCFDSVMVLPYTPEEKDFYTTDYFTNYALQWLEDYRGDERPFFLYLAYTAPHDPLMAWPEDIAKYRGKYDEGYASVRQKRFQKQLETGLISDKYILSDPTHKAWEDLSNQEKEFEAGKMEVYAAMIDRMDQNIGRILDKLRERGDLNNTLIMFVSDNGASAEVVRLDTDDDHAGIGSMARWISLGPGWANVGNTPFRYYKNQSYEGGINTPMIVYWAGKIEAGSLARFTGHFIDFMPTLAEVSGAEYPESYNGQLITPMQGQSLLPVFKGQTGNREKALYWEWNGGMAFRKGDWKIVRLNRNKGWELYNMREDPTETQDLAGEKPELLREMDSIYQGWYKLYY